MIIKDENKKEENKNENLSKNEKNILKLKLLNEKRKKERIRKKEKWN